MERGMQERVERAAAALYSRHPDYETVATEINGKPAKITVPVPWERAADWRRTRLRDLAGAMLAAADLPTS